VTQTLPAATESSLFSSFWMGAFSAWRFFLQIFEYYYLSEENVFADSVFLVQPFPSVADFYHTAG